VECGYEADLTQLPCGAYSIVLVIEKTPPRRGKSRVASAGPLGQVARRQLREHNVFCLFFS
jgi:hypothetical protein